MPKGGQRDLAKAQYWRQVFADWRASGLSGAEFCRRNELKYTQFIDWQKRLRRQDAATERISRSPHQQVMARRARRIAAKPQQEKVDTAQAVEFAEARLVDRQVQSFSPPVPEQTSTLELVFASGIRLRISAGCSMNLLSSVVSVLENR